MDDPATTDPFAVEPAAPTVEPAATVKLNRLREVAHRRGRIDAGGYIVDIYGPSIQTLQPAMHTTTSVNGG